MSKKKNKSPKTYIHYEPVVECLVCGHEHLHKQRKRVAQKKDSPYLFIRVCPRCAGEGYVMYGDKAIRRKVKDQD